MTHACCNIVLIREMKGLTRENGDKSGFLPNPIVASDQTTINDVAASTIALARITQGLATHLYIIQSDLTDFPSACHGKLPSQLFWDFHRVACIALQHMLLRRHELTMMGVKHST